MAGPSTMVFYQSANLGLRFCPGDNILLQYITSDNASAVCISDLLPVIPHYYNYPGMFNQSPYEER